MFSDEYSRKVLPFINKEYFESYHEQEFLKRLQNLLLNIIIFPQRKFLL